MLAHRAFVLHRTLAIGAACSLAVACGELSDPVVLPESAGGEGGASSSATAGVGGTDAEAMVGSGGAGGASASSTGGASGAPCLDIAVIAEENTSNNTGGASPTGPCEVDLTGLLTNVNLDTLEAKLHEFNAPTVVLERVPGQAACAQNPAAYDLEAEVFKLCPATCETIDATSFEKLTITADCIR